MIGQVGLPTNLQRPDLRARGLDASGEVMGFAGARARAGKLPKQSLRFLQSVGKIGQPARTLGRRYVTRYSNHIVPRSFANRRRI